MRPGGWAAWALLPLLGAFLPSALYAEDVVLEEPPRATARLDVLARGWTLKKGGSSDVKVSEVATPLRARARVARGTEVFLCLPAAIASYKGDGESDFSGLVDWTLGASLRLDEGRIRLGASVGIPTGKAPLDSDERTVADVAANRILGFPVKRLGEGLDLGVNAARVFLPTRKIAFSVGAGYLLKGEYDFLQTGEEDVRFKPGDEVFAGAGAEGETSVGEAVLTLRADGRYRLFSKDERNGEAFFEEGDQVEIIGSAGLLFPSARRVDVRLFVVFKGEGSEAGEFGEASLDSLSLERYLLQSLTGDYQEAVVWYTHPVADNFGLLATGSVANYSEYPATAGATGNRLLGSARIWEFGGGGFLRVSSHYELLLRGAYLSGNAEDGAVDLSGYDFSAGLQWTY